MKQISLVLSILLLFSHTLFAQLDSIYDQNVWRTFIVHLPINYSSNNHYPIVLNLHGYNSEAALQQSYSQFDIVADSEGFIVVYPNGVDNSWAINGASDVDFLSHLVDTIRTDYSCNSCLFVTGMSDGGFMTYKFACATSQTITAIAVGSGNMSNSLQNSSASAPKIPIMHFHGTEDPLVAYGGVFPLIPPVDTTIQWWVNHNNCNPTPVFTSIPNINTSDNSTVEEYYYGNGSNGSEVTFYKVINGGHTWSGAVSAPPLGNTNQDINQSAIIGSFFNVFCSVTAEVDNSKRDNSLSVFPNPFTNKLSFSHTTDKRATITLHDPCGRLILKQAFTKTLVLETDELMGGTYFYEVLVDDNIVRTGKVLKPNR